MAGDAGERIEGGAPIALDDDARSRPRAFTLLRGGGGPAPSSEPVIASCTDPLRIDDPTIDHASVFLREVAASAVHVLVLGETGVGKEVLAETVHALSARTGPLVRVNCAALSDSLLESELFGHARGAFTGAMQARAGLIEAAAGGTLFFDEIGELPLGIQAKLLRALESREVLRLGSTTPVAVDVRFLAATNRDLPAEVEVGRFRRDLFFRLDGVTLRIPPLRERRAMIAPLAARFLAHAARPPGAPRSLTPAVLAMLEAHTWPGNVRELKTVIERAALLARGGDIAPLHVAFTTLRTECRPATLLVPEDALAFLSDEQQRERAAIVTALERRAGNQTRAAQDLGIARSTLTSRLQLYRISRPKAG